MKSELLKSLGVPHDFGNRLNPVGEEFSSSWENSRPHWKQVHGTATAEVTQSSQDLGEVDAMMTSKSNLPIGVRTADCVPILLADRSGRAVAAVHSGWRGTIASAVNHCWETLVTQSHSPKNWVAVVGPCIGRCCYEIDLELFERFSTTHSNVDIGKQVSDTKAHLDLKNINTELLKKIGFSEVETMSQCTHCHKTNNEWTFCSYRRDGGSSRQTSIIATDQPV